MAGFTYSGDSFFTGIFNTYGVPNHEMLITFLARFFRMSKENA